jgi:ABC-type antimicrobial peptide transport system permease subunit
VFTLAGVGYLRSLLFGLEPLDPFALALATLAVITVTTIAAWLPARRATRIDPMSALQ